MLYVYLSVSRNIILNFVRFIELQLVKETISPFLTLLSNDTHLLTFLRERENYLETLFVTKNVLSSSVPIDSAAWSFFACIAEVLSWMGALSW